MDGVLVDFESDQPIPGAREFVARFSETGTPFVLLTNNCALTQHDLADKLQAMGLDVTPDSIYTSGMAAADRLSSRDPGGSVYVVGGEALKQELRSRGMQVVGEDAGHADHVLIGQLNDGLPEGSYALDSRMFQKAALFLHNGADLTATDISVGGPGPDGFYLATGAWTSILASATGVEAECAGKPAPFGMDAAVETLGCQPAEAVVVGDSMNTDIRIGHQAGCQTALVLTGNTSRDTLGNYTFAPTQVFDSVADLVDVVGKPDPLAEAASARAKGQVSQIAAGPDEADGQTHGKPADNADNLVRVLAADPAQPRPCSGGGAKPTRAATVARRPAHGDVWAAASARIGARRGVEH